MALKHLLSAVLTHCVILNAGELEEGAFFGKTTLPGTSQPVKRVSNLDAARFEELALEGIPFVIEDGGKDHPHVGWTCDRFGREFENGVLKMEYVKGARKSTWAMKDDWQKELFPLQNADPEGPQFAPWYWGVKGADEPEEKRTIFTGNRNPLPAVQEKMRLPPWMRDNKRNRREVLGSPEFWFSAPRAGAAMHMDSHCESTYAIQLSGTRKWRLGWVPRVPNGTFYKEGTYADGAIYGKGYRPPMEAIVREGEALVMPSGFLHETTNIGGDCAVSLTFQFKDPIPARYFRTFASDLRHTGDFGECWDLINDIARQGKIGHKFEDRVGDGRLSLAVKPGEEDSFMSRAVHGYYDADRDGVVTKEEVQKGFEDWTRAARVAEDEFTTRIIPASFEYLYPREEL